MATINLDCRESNMQAEGQGNKGFIFEALIISRTSLSVILQKFVKELQQDSKTKIPSAPRLNLFCIQLLMENLDLIFKVFSKLLNKLVFRTVGGKHLLRFVYRQSINDTKKLFLIRVFDEILMIRSFRSY